MSVSKPFLATHEFRPWSSSRVRAPKLRGYALGSGDAALQVLVGDWKSKPREDELRALWKERKGQKPFPLLLVALYGDRAALCGPTGEDPLAHMDLDPGQVERLCAAALGEPDRHAAVRYLNTALPGLEGPSPGVRNEGLFATHELDTGVLARADWRAATEKSLAVLKHRGRPLLEALGYTIEPMRGPTWLLKVGRRNIAVAVFLDRGESADLGHPDFSEMSPVSYALARADEQNIPYVIVESGSALRVHPTSTSVGVGRRGRTETYFEVQLDLLPDSRAGYLWLFLAAENLDHGGAFEEVLESSKRFASGLGERLRDRIYDDVVPRLAAALVDARALSAPGAEELSETYGAALFLLFRVLFIAYAEDKDLLPYDANGLYRKRSLKSIADDLLKVTRAESDFGPDPVLWGQLDAIFKAVRNGNRAWGVPAYNGALFSDDPDVSELGALLEGVEIPDRALGPILTALLLDDGPEGLGPVDFRSLGVREFGTVYEGLLEQELSVAPCDLALDKRGAYVPAKGHAKIVVPAGGVYVHNASGARKSSGSYYTKSFAVDHLLEHALDPALDAHLARLDELDDNDAAAEFFRFYVADIAMGSGHFLVAAVDRIEPKLHGYLARRPLPGVTDELQRLRKTAAENLGQLADRYEIEDTRLLRRQIARRCIYGVDVNPMSVQLARLSLWIHTFVPGLPLSFLDRSLVQGNSLVGVATFDEVTSALADESGHASDLFSLSPEAMLAAAEEPLARLARLSDGTKAEVLAARKALADAHEAVRPAEALMDIVAASRLDDELAHEVRTGYGADGNLLADISSLPDCELHRRAKKLLEAIPPFHFPIAFPEVFLRERPGFDVILGNPPWEKIRVEEHGFWSRHVPGFKGLKQSEREELTPKLRKRRPDLVRALDREVAAAKLLRGTLVRGPFPGMGTGDPDLYKAFTWRFWYLLAAPGGHMGVVLARSVLAAKGSELFRLELLENGEFKDLTFLLNRGGWVFDEAEHRYTIALLSVAKRRPHDPVVPLRGPYASEEAYRVGTGRVGNLGDPAGSYSVVPVSEIREWSDSAAFPLLPAEDSLEVFRQLRKSPRLDAAIEGSWRARPIAELHATNDKPLMTFTEGNGLWPVYKGESFDLWNPDTGTYYAWVDPAKITRHLQEKRLRQHRNRRSAFHEFDEQWAEDETTLPCLHPRIAFRDVSRATDTRTVRCALIPGQVCVNHKAPFLLFPSGGSGDVAAVLGVMSALPLDWYARRFVETSLTFHVLNPLPIPRPASDSILGARLIALAGRLAAPDERFAEWAEDVGVECGPIPDDEKADMIRELDAVVAHLYGLNERHLRHIFETFHEGWDYEERLRATLRHFRDWKKRR